MNSQNKPVKTRFAPSPTGFLHIGGVRTALFSWLYAKHCGGQFVLRIEDTDTARSTAQMTEQILASLKWLGIDHDGEVVYQSARKERYAQAAKQLLDQGKAYHCYCSKEELDAQREEQLANQQKPRYDGRCRERSEARAGVEPIIRFCTPKQGSVVFEDCVHQRIEIANSELDDLVILRADGMPTYNFCVVVDDLDMEITHIVRGDDHLSNTPRQIHIWEALGATPPKFAHLPMILDENGKKLSKRTGAAGIDYYQGLGYLPQALKNYLLRLGWSHGDQEIFSQQEMIDLFDFDTVSHSPAALNLEKLDWLNSHYLNEMPSDELSEQLSYYINDLGWDINNGPEVKSVLPMLCERYKTLRAMAQGAQFLYCEKMEWDADKRDQHLSGDKRDLLQAVLDKLQSLEPWEEGAIKAAIDAILVERGIKMKELGGLLRYVLTAGLASPGLALTLQSVGKQRSLERIQQFMAL